MKKKIALLLSIIMVVSVFAACGNKTNNNSSTAVVDGDFGGLEIPIKNNGEEIKWVCITDTAATNDLYAQKRLAEVTGVNIKFEVNPSSGWKQKLNVLLAGRELPDIIGQLAMMTSAQLNDYGKQGAFAEVTQHLDIMPNFSKFLKENDTYIKSYGNLEGKLYGFPRFNIGNQFEHGVSYRKDIMDKHGLKMWTNKEEFYQTLKKIKELYPKMVPLTNKYGTFFFYHIANQWAYCNNDVYFDEESKTWKFSNTEEGYRDMLDYLKKLYSEGLLDPEFATRTSADFSSILSRGEAFAALDIIGRDDILNEQSSIEGYEMEMGAPIGPAGTMSVANVTIPAIAVANNKNQEISMQLMDFLYSPYGIQLMSIGEEGVTYNKTDKEDIITFIDCEESQANIEVKYGLMIQGSFVSLDSRTPINRYSEGNQKIIDEIYSKKYVELNPVIPFTDEEGKKVSEIRAKLENPGYEFSFKYVIGQASTDKDWENWKKEAERLGSKELVKIHNDAYKRFIK